mgnify:FL=1
MADVYNVYPDYPYLNNLRCRIEQLGYPACLASTTGWSSASRLGMFSSMINQFLIVDGAEFNNIFSGTEYNFGQYAFDFSQRDQDVEVLDVFPKYQAMQTEAKNVGLAPQIMVIYRGLKDNKVGYFTVDRYFYMSEGYGCSNVFSKHINTFLKKGMHIDQSEKLVYQPNQKGNKYCFGVNAKTAYMTMSQTDEDAIVISKSFAKKLESTAMHKLIINTRQDCRPLNLNGNEHTVKILPDIGEKVRDDGILCAFRPINSATYAADTDPESLRQVQPLCDYLVTVPKGATVVDIEVYSSKRSVASMYHQVLKYQDGLKRYHERIVENYNKLPKPKKITPAYSSLVANSMTHLIASGQDPNNFLRMRQRTKIDIEGMDNQPIECLQFVVTLMVKRKVGPGSKLSGLDGS